MESKLWTSPVDGELGRDPRATPYRPLLWLAAALGVGVAFDYMALGESNANFVGAWWRVAVVALVLAGLARIHGRAVIASALMLAAAAALGGAWEHWRWNYVAANDLGLFAAEAPQPTCVEAVLAERVQITPAGERSPLRAMPARTMSEATVRAIAIRDGATWRAVDGKSRLRVAGELRGVVPGDRLLVFAQLGRQPPPLNPGQYDWAAAERRAGRLCELYCDDPQCVAVSQPAPAWGAGRLVFALRSWCTDQLAAAVGPRDAPIVLATFLGDQERLSEETKDAFLQTGAIHLLVISGAHVALLAMIVHLATRLVGLSARRQLGVTLAVLLLYAAVVGYEPSVTRATLLAVAMLLALEVGRPASAGNLLGGAALVVMAINPNELFRSGTQFSFLAVAALIVAGRWFMRPRAVAPLKRHIAETRPWQVKLCRKWAKSFAILVGVSIAVGVAVAPLVAYHFHVVTPASVLLTPLASPLVGIAIAAGLAAITLGWLIPPLAPLFGAVCGNSLHYTEFLVKTAQAVPGAFGYCASPGIWWLCILYGAGGIMAAVPALRPRGSIMLSLAMLWAAVGYVSLDASRPAEGELRCTFLSVGHGTCVVLELPSRQTILYDAGSIGSPEMATQIISSYLWERGISRIEAIVLSHADIDHYNGVPGLLERFPVGAVYVSPMMFDPLLMLQQPAAPKYLQGVLENSGVPLVETWMGDRLRTETEGATIEVLHPPKEGMMGRDNANSLLLSVEFAGRRILLPGDLESPGIERVMADPPVDCDVLLAPHHGSELSDPPGFAAWSSPEWTVMSGRHPSRTLASIASYEQQGAQVLHTAFDGAITCVISPDGVEVDTFR